MAPTRSHRVGRTGVDHPIRTTVVSTVHGRAAESTVSTHPRR
jgi:hypothetical protein